MNRGRPKAIGPYKTRAELVAGSVRPARLKQKYARHCPNLKSQSYNHRKNYQGKPISIKVPFK
jgi:hypothetical protein